jgi:3-phosphoshikimate 1-carboxyvinyltransferase
MSASSRSVIVHPLPAVAGSFAVPGDKSISHRVAMLSGIASGTSTIEGFLESEDCLNTVEAMVGLGARSERLDGGVLQITGTGGRMVQPAGPLDMGNSGTGMRLMAGLLAGQPLEVELTGDASLRTRPMKRISDPLLAMGADVELMGEGGRPPIRIRGGRLSGIHYDTPVASAQVKSAILLAGLFAEGETVVTEPAPSRDHTERLLKMLGVPLRIEGNSIGLTGYGSSGPAFEARHWIVPGDFSSAAYFIAAAAVREGDRVCIERVGLNSRRSALLAVLKRMGADIQVREDDTPEGGEPLGTVIVQGRRLHGVEVKGDEIPALIDELPLLAAVGALSEGETVIRDAAELRVKESDRIATTALNLKKFGIEVEELNDGMIVHGGQAAVSDEPVLSHGDHRIAMSMAVVALHADKPVCISNVDCVATSYPAFWEHLRRIGAHVE